MAKFSGESINDLFDWGNDRFVLGKLPEQGGNSTKRKKSHYDIFMEAILEEEQENKAAEETPAKVEEEEGPAHNEDEYGPLDDSKEAEKKVEEKKAEAKKEEAKKAEEKKADQKKVDEKKVEDVGETKPRDDTARVAEEEL